MENKFKLFLIIILTIGFGVVISCGEEGWGCMDKLVPPNTNPPQIGLNVETLIATKITDSTATLNAVVYPDNTWEYVSFISFTYCFVDSVGQKVTFDTPPIQVDPYITGSFYESTNINGLSVGTTYFYYVRAWNKLGQAPLGSTVAFATTPPQDKLFEGGIKFYVDSTGQHGLIASPNDQSIGEIWSYCDYPNGISVNGTGTSIGTGQANTTAIVTAYSSGNSAAKLCDNLVLNGYSDWFLPSKDELNLLYTQRTVVGGFSPDAFYWSSSENSANFAWAQSFDNDYGTQEQEVKSDNSIHVRAIRAY